MDKKNSSFDEILDDLFRIGVDNLRMMEHKVLNRCDEETLRDMDHDDEHINVSTTEEIEEVQVEDVEMDENHDVDHVTPRQGGNERRNERGIVTTH
ncbi:hypothetical protein Tco_1527420 [Tanacetum coccineum]